MSAGQASFYGTEAKAVLKHRLKKLFMRYHVELAVTIISIRIQGPLAFDWGWHKLTLTPRKGGRSVTTRTRYLEIWQRDPAGQWKIAIFLDNLDVPPQMPPKEVLAEMGTWPAVRAGRAAGKRRAKVRPAA
jgi:ketosteroid isomerase-like protein